MSDEEYIVDDDNEQWGEDDGGIEADGEMFDGEEGQAEDQSPEGMYRQAKDNLGFDDDMASYLFLTVYNIEEADPILRGRALLHSGIIAASRDDLEQLEGITNEIFTAYEADMMEDKKVRKTIQAMLINVMHSEEALTKFLDITVERINRNSMMDIYLDLKLKQAEQYMKYGNYPQARALIPEIQQYCPYPPDASDQAMCKATVRILVIQLELADLDNDEKATFQCYENASKLNQEFLDQRQKAMLTKIEGLMAMRKGDTKEARIKFFEAFKMFDAVGSDKRITCLPYTALAAMCNHEEVSIFMMPEVRPYNNHPFVAPLSQLQEAYQRADIGLFNKRIPSASQIFNDDQQYKRYIDQIRIYVLSNAILRFCRAYKRVNIEYIAKSLDSPISEVKLLVFKLILSKKLNGLVEAETNCLIMKAEKVASLQLRGISRIVDNTELAISQIESSIKKWLF